MVPSVANPWAMPIPKPMSCPHRRHVSVKAPIDASSILSWGGNGAAPVVSFFGIHVTTHLRQRGGHSAPDLADQPPIWRVVKANLKFSLKKSFCIGLTVERCSHIVYRPDFAFHFAFSVSTADTDFANATCSHFSSESKATYGFPHVSPRRGPETRDFLPKPLTPIPMAALALAIGGNPKAVADYLNGGACELLGEISRGGGSMHSAR